MATTRKRTIKRRHQQQARTGPRLTDLLAPPPKPEEDTLKLVNFRAPVRLLRRLDLAAEQAGATRTALIKLAIERLLRLPV